MLRLRFSLEIGRRDPKPSLDDIQGDEVPIEDDEEFEGEVRHVGFI